MTLRHNVGAFILTHGRPDRQDTYTHLVKDGFTGPIKFVVDNEDDTVEEYRERFGADNVIVFDKEAISRTFDTMDQANADRRTIVYARNACHQIANDLGWDYYIELDDDYDAFYHRYAEGGSLRGTQVKDLDRTFSAMIDWLEESGALTVAMAQGGDYMGGAQSPAYRKRMLRKAMNSFVIRSDRPVNFIGRINEDVNTYVGRGRCGELFLTEAHIGLNQKTTQTNEGGMTDVYQNLGTYRKSFYTVMIAPSCVQVRVMGRRYMRAHHHVNWRKAVPMIVSDKWRKE